MRRKRQGRKPYPEATVGRCLCRPGRRRSRGPFWRRQTRKDIAEAVACKVNSDEGVGRGVPPRRRLGKVRKAGPGIRIDPLEETLEPTLGIEAHEFLPLITVEVVKLADDTSPKNWLPVSARLRISTPHGCRCRRVAGTI